MFISDVDPGFILDYSVTENTDYGAVIELTLKDIVDDPDEEILRGCNLKRNEKGELVTII